MSEEIIYIARDAGGELWLYFDTAPVWDARNGRFQGGGAALSLGYEKLPEIKAGDCRKARIVLDEVKK